MFFPDPVLESHSTDEPRPYLKRTGLICSHCHKEIRGRFHNLGNKFYDEYCFSLRYILEAQEMELSRIHEMKKRMDITME